MAKEMYLLEFQATHYLVVFFLFLLCDMTVKSAVMIRCRHNDQQGYAVNS